MTRLGDRTGRDDILRHVLHGKRQYFGGPVVGWSADGPDHDITA